MEQMMLRMCSSFSSSCSSNSAGEELLLSNRSVWVNGPVIVGAGPSGLAVGACLREEGVPFVVIERAECIASLWQKRTYNRLKLHLPKKFCQLPKMPFPEDYPEYPTKNQFVSYLQNYADTFQINPRFNESVHSARFDHTLGLWRVTTRRTSQEEEVEVEYICRWLVVATGENAERVVPDIDGLNQFSGKVIHACDYRSGEEFKGKKVLVVGCGNSGMEVSLDLSNHNAFPNLVCRSSVHVLPRETLGRSTFELAFILLKWLPLWLVDKLLLVLAWLILGNVEKYGLKRPSQGPLELKNTQGKSPVLDIGALSKIQSGQIKVVPGIKKFWGDTVEFVNGESRDIDAVVLATGYRSNVPYWLKESDFFGKNGYPKSTCQSGWKGNGGLYAVGFSRKGLAGVSMDAANIAQDITRVWKEETKHKKQNIPRLRRCISTF